VSPPHATFVLHDLPKNGPQCHVICITHCHFLGGSGRMPRREIGWRSLGGRVGRRGPEGRETKGWSWAIGPALRARGSKFSRRSQRSCSVEAAKLVDHVSDSACSSVRRRECRVWMVKGTDESEVLGCGAYRISFTFPPITPNAATDD
jgi:hypothetical protein